MSRKDAIIAINNLLLGEKIILDNGVNELSKLKESLSSSLDPVNFIRYMIEINNALLKNKISRFTNPQLTEFTRLFNYLIHLWINKDKPLRDNIISYHIPFPLNQFVSKYDFYFQGKGKRTIKLNETINMFIPMDDKQFACLTLPRELFVFNIETGEQIWKTEIHGEYSILEYSPSGYFIRSFLTDIKLITKDVSFDIKAHDSCVTYLCILDKTYFLTGSQSGDIKLWNIYERRMIQKFEGHTSPITCITKIDDTKFISGDSNKEGQIISWEISKKGPLHNHKCGSEVKCLLVRDDVIFAGTQKGDLHKMTLNLNPLKVVNVVEDIIVAMNFLPGDRLVIKSRREGRKVIDIDTLVKEYSFLFSWNDKIDVLPDNNIVYLNGNNLIKIGHKAKYLSEETWIHFMVTSDGKLITGKRDIKIWE